MCLIIKASFTLSRFSVPVALRSRHRGPPGPHRSDASKHSIESGYTVLNRRLTGSGPGDFIFLKQPGLTGTQRGAKQRRLSPGHHLSSSGMNRISTVKPPGDTVANRHELCLWWSYGVSRLSTVCHGGKPA